MFCYRWEYVWTKIDLWNHFRVEHRPKATLRQMGYRSRMVAYRVWIITKDGKALRPHDKNQIIDDRGVGVCQKVKRLEPAGRAKGVRSLSSTNQPV